VQVAPCFPTECKDLPAQLLDLLENKSELLDPALRQTVVQSLIMLQNRELLPRLTLLPALFKLFRVPDKNLRKLLFSHIVNDIRLVNRKTKNVKLNNSLQSFMFTMLKDEHVAAARKSLDVMIELWRRKVRAGLLINGSAVSAAQPLRSICSGLGGRQVRQRDLAGVLLEGHQDHAGGAALLPRSRASRRGRPRRELGFLCLLPTWTQLMPCVVSLGSHRTSKRKASAARS
jgi:hypothetical protein